MVIELKGTEGKGLPEAFNQIETYKDQVPELFRANLLSVISDGITARYGSVSADFDRFMRWRTVDGETLVDEGSALALETLIRGLLAPPVLLAMLRRFVVFEDEGRGPVKKIAGYHQFHAVRKGLARVLEARDGRRPRRGHLAHAGLGQVAADGLPRRRADARAGAGEPDPRGADRPQRPRPAALRHLRPLRRALRRGPGAGRRHRRPARQARRPQGRRRDLHHHPEVPPQARRGRVPGADRPLATSSSSSTRPTARSTASRRAWTPRPARCATASPTTSGARCRTRPSSASPERRSSWSTPTPTASSATRSTSTTSPRRCSDGATVPIYYEARVAKIEIDPELEGVIDPEFDDATAGIGEDARAATARRWARVEALVGADKRLDTVVADILEHFDRRQEAIDGKAMIVCMSRQIAAKVYQRIVAARPDWHSDQDDAGAVKVVITGNATDPKELQPHIRSKARQEALRNRYRKPDDPLKLVIVCDMWLTGFDAPVMHTLYVDKPMKGHGLMQAIARVNRVFRDKPAGLVVDYIGLAADLKAALAHYSASDRTQTGVDTAEAVRALLTALDVLRADVPRHRLPGRPRRHARRPAENPAEGHRARPDPRPRGAGRRPRGGEDREPQALPRRRRGARQGLQARRRHAGGGRREGGGRLLPRRADRRHQARRGRARRPAPRRPPTSPSASSSTRRWRPRRSWTSSPPAGSTARTSPSSPTSSSPSFSRWSRRTSPWRP